MTAAPIRLRPLLAEADGRLVRAVDALSDAGYGEPSALPGWTRAHVVAHLALNAEALTGVVDGALRGEAVPMYPTQEARDADIAEVAGSGIGDPGPLRTRLLGGVGRLAAALDAYDARPADTPPATTPVPRTSDTARTFPLGQVTGMRLREVEIHLLDLAVGLVLHDWSTAFAEHVVDARVAGLRTDAIDLAPTVLESRESGQRWLLGSGRYDGSWPPVVTGSAADLAWWVTGRGSGDGLTVAGGVGAGVLPDLGAWR